MKKRIIAILLSLAVLCCSLSCGKRASAAPAVGAAVALFALAANLLGVMTGQCDTAAQLIGDVLESGVDAFTNPDSWFQQNWTTGADILPPSTAAFAFEQIRNTVEGWFNNGELQIENGQIKLTYDQYLQLYGEVISVSSKPDLSFECGYDYYFLSPFRQTFSPVSIPQISAYFTDTKNKGGQSVIPVFYSDDVMYFAPCYFNMMSYPYGGFVFSVVQLRSDIYGVDYFGSFSTSSSYSSFSEAISEFQPIISLNPFYGKIDFLMSGSKWNYERTFDYLFKFDGTSVTSIPKSEFSDEGLTAGYVTTIGDVAVFLRSIRGYTPDLVPPANLDDLSDVLPTEYNPSLSFPVDPDLTRPLPNQVIVGDVPGVADLPLSEYQAEIKTEIEVPSIICTKFPFCIPYDFIRFLGLLCSDPVAPVFRIPISTSPDNLEQWSGNVTVNEYLNPDDLMFEIDEEIVIDLSVIPLVQPICYTCFIVGFIFLLLHITPKMIQH